MRTPGGLVVGAAVALLLAGAVVFFVVRDDGGSGGERRPAPVQTAAVDAVEPLPDLRVPVGGEAVFRNDDDVEHTFTADGGLFDSGRVAPGGTFRFSFPAAGEATYHCEIHPSMKGRIVVEPAVAGASS